MARYLHFLLAGMVLGLFTEALFKLAAGIHPEAFPITLVVYPILLTVAYLGGGLVNRFVESTLRADLITYFGAGIIGLAIEWTLLGNGPGSNAIQIGMFAMWTTFCFGPRVLTRPATRSMRRWFWGAFVGVALVITPLVLILPNPKARVVVAVLAMTASNLIWSAWVGGMAWRTRHETRLTR